ncbi:MAG: hypothetical protein GY948_15735 [Alphaproteobacteria bacterium]|nr:hypothetical protein [Alphaproteobacteria bacterium]
MRYSSSIFSVGLFIVFFALPIFSVSFYQAFVSTDRYESAASTIITEQKPSVTSLDLSLIGLPSTASDHDAHVVKTLVLSKDMVRYLDEKIQLREHFSNLEVDYFSRLETDATFEDFHELYRDYFTVDYNVETKILRIAVQAFDRAYAQKALELILERSDEFIDSVNNRMSKEQVRFFRLEEKKRKQEMLVAKAKLLAFQQANKIYSTEAEAQTIFTTIGALETLAAQKQSELDSRAKILSKNSAILQELGAQIASLQRQITSEKARLAGGQGRDISEIQSDFLAVQLELELATTAFKSTLTTLEQVRIEAARKLKFLIVVTEPSLADDSEFPRRWYIVISTIMISLMLYVVASLVMAIIREHA